MKMIYSTYNGVAGTDDKKNPYGVFVKFLARKTGIKGLNILQNSPLVGRDQFVPIDMAPRLEKMDYFTSHLYNTFHSTIMPTLLRNYDRYSMIASVESRMPLMDHRLVTFAFSLPWSSKLRNGFTKAILRDAVKDYMPKSVNQRKAKIGFNSPIVEWMKGDWKEYLMDSIHSQEFNQCDMINSKLLKKQIENILISDNTTNIKGQDVWRYFSTFLWYKTFYKTISKK